jgi:hypothetical protein
MPWARRLFLLAFSALFACVALSPDPGPLRWYKGNTHTHTLWSDGDAAPEQAVHAYRSRGYHFLVLSDHNILLEGEKWRPVGEARGQVKPAAVEALKRTLGEDAPRLRTREGLQELRLATLSELKARFEAPGAFLLVPGEEITDTFQKLPIHHNALNLGAYLPPTGGASVRDVMARTVAAVEAEARRLGREVLVHLNHPNFHWAVTAEDLAHVLGERFFEVYNGHRGVRNYGDAEHPGTERIWDVALSLRLGVLGGPPIFGLATDDAHHYHQAGAVAAPGRGWIQVRARSLDPESLLRAMNAGDFYASSGVTLDEVVRSAAGLDLRIAADPGVSYRTRFIGTRRGGAPGELLAEVEGPAASYRFRGDELYVRATVVSSRPHPDGYDPGDLESAWVQPALPR